MIRFYALKRWIWSKARADSIVWMGEGNGEGVTFEKRHVITFLLHGKECDTIHNFLSRSLYANI